MLFHSVINSDDERISEKIIEQQQKEKFKNTMYKSERYCKRTRS